MQQLFPTIGIIGGGQLGKMLLEQTMLWQVPTVVLDQDIQCSAAPYTHELVIGSITDADAIEVLAKKSDIVTFEIEHINVAKLDALHQQGKKIIPFPSVLNIIKDKSKQKLFYQQHQIPTAPFVIVDNKQALVEHLAYLKQYHDKVAVKTCTGGYDGKGVFITTIDELETNINIIPFDDALMVESFVNYTKELAVIVAKDTKGNIKTYPCIEMEFDEQSNLVAFLISPAAIDESIENKAQQIALQAVAAFDSPGLFAVELFLTEDNDVLVNEIAPRPHNSAHHTIEGFYTSQYEQLIRILLDMPLGNTDMIMPCAMINIVGTEKGSGHYKLKHWESLNSMNGIYVHLYGKQESKPNRKLGHITIIHPDRTKVLELAQKVRTLTEIEIIDNE